VKHGIHWFRNDLRLHDNQGLSALADRVDAWLPLFILDPNLASRDGGQAPRVRFMFDCLSRLEADLRERGFPMLILEGDPEELIPKIMDGTGATLVSWNSGSTPFARRRDSRVSAAVSAAGGESIELGDHTVFGAEEIKTKAGGYYSVYTPYRNEWWRTWHRAPRLPASRVRLPKMTTPSVDIGSMKISPADLVKDGEQKLPRGGELSAKRRLRQFLAGTAGRYDIDRDRPEIDGTSRLSPYLRFGAISIRRCFSEALSAIERDPSSKTGISKWMDELIWREFYNAVVFHAPHVLSGSFRPEYDAIRWRGRPSHFAAWCEGRTGYPFVDAAMRQLSATGWMHNRARMVVASFLTKDLHIDWRKGERFFFESLVDGDPASNNGGWQWSASTGTDAQPYFRIFNPVTQGQKWDPKGVYIRRWIPELRHLASPEIHRPWEQADARTEYPRPIVDHSVQRVLTIAEFKRVRAIRE